MDWAYKGVITAAMVALVLLAGQMFGRRIAGMLAGLPIISGPAFVWMAEDFGPAFAAHSAAGAVAASSGCALYALIFALLAGPLPTLVAFVIALAAGLGASAALGPLGAWPLVLLAVAMATVYGVLCALPARPPEAGPMPKLPNALLIVSVCAGVISSAMALLGPRVGPIRGRADIGGAGGQRSHLAVSELGLRPRCQIALLAWLRGRPVGHGCVRNCFRDLGRALAFGTHLCGGHDCGRGCSHGPAWAFAASWPVCGAAERSPSHGRS